MRALVNRTPPAHLIRLRYGLPALASLGRRTQHDDPVADRVRAPPRGGRAIHELATEPVPPQVAGDTNAVHPPPSAGRRPSGPPGGALQPQRSALAERWVGGAE